MQIRWFVRLRNNELYRITYISVHEICQVLAGKIRQNNHANSSGKFRLQEIRQIGFPQFVYSFVYSMDVMQSFPVFCSYKLEFYHERLSVSQKARIKLCCESGHRGWGCNDPELAVPDFTLLVSTLLLTLTNMATLPAVVLALFRHYTTNSQDTQK
jgi:hypothetical protein